MQKQTNATKNLTRSTTKNKRNTSFKLNFLAQTHIPRHPCSPEPPYNILWHFLALTQKDITAWVDPIKGSNVNHRKKWGTNGVRGTQLYNQWTRHTIRLIKHRGPPTMQQLRFTSTKSIPASCSLHRSVLGEVKNPSTTYLKQRFISVTCRGEGHKPDVQDVTYGQNLKWS